MAFVAGSPETRMMSSNVDHDTSDIEHCLSVIEQSVDDVLRTMRINEIRQFVAEILVIVDHDLMPLCQAVDRLLH